MNCIVQPKQPKQLKAQKQPKLIKLEEHKQLTSDQYVYVLIEEKEKQLENNYSEIHELNDLINPN
jgi:hypothetical protein